jgi:membrane glycosyltransferase
MIPHRFASRLVLCLAALAASTADLWACAACFGQSDSAMAKGMNMGIFALLLIITSVLAGVAGFFVFLIRRSSQLAESQHPVSEQLSQTRTNA